MQQSCVKSKSQSLQSFLLDLKNVIHFSQIENLLRQIQVQNPPKVNSVYTYAHGQSAASTYAGAVFDPLNQKIIFIPSRIESGFLQRYNCLTGQVESYPHSFGNLGSSRYYGGVFDPHNLRIVFVPYGVFNDPEWHYYDCVREEMVTYNHGQAISGTTFYIGGSFDPVNQRIVFIPSINQAWQANWHYYDCLENTPTIRSYTLSSPPAFGAGYAGGVYEPQTRRIIFAPYGGSSSTFHYYDCLAASESNRIVSYTHGFNLATHFPYDYPYQGAIYDPINHRVLFVPFSQTQVNDWHYYDPVTENLGSYTHGQSTALMRSSGGVFDPFLRKIFFVPFHDSNPLFYYDCDSQSVGTDDLGETLVAQSYIGGAYDPIHNRVIFAPHIRAEENTWHGIQNYAMPSDASLSLMSHYLFNKF